MSNFISKTQRETTFVDVYYDTLKIQPFALRVANEVLNANVLMRKENIKKFINLRVAKHKKGVCTWVNQKVLPVLSTETLLHIWLSTEYYGFRPSSTAVDTVS